MKHTSFQQCLLIAILVACLACTSRADTRLLSKYVIVPGAVDRVEILYFPERILTRTGLTPEMLERQYRYKLEIREFGECLQRQELVKALQGSTFLQGDRQYDLRTAVLLYDKDGKRILSLYFDQSGRRGMINRDPASTSSDVYRWAKSMIKGFAD
jgi:hypothetical protein